MATAPPTANANSPWPLYDIFLDLPHPAASKTCPPPFLVNSPSADSDEVNKEITKNVAMIARFAFPEYDQQQEEARLAANPAIANSNLNRYDMYAVQHKSFQSFTFSMQLGTGIRLHGHVRRYMPPHLEARTRYDVGRRGERALVIMTRASGADMLYSAILK